MSKPSESLEPTPHRFTGLQLALGHFSFPLGQASEAIDRLYELRERLKEEEDDDAPALFRALTPCKPLQTGGQTDLLLIISPQTFRLLPRVALRALSSNVACQWSLAKEVTSRPAREHEDDAPTPLFASSDASPAFVCYLRANRAIYHGGGGIAADSHIVRTLEESLESSDAQGMVTAGLGWFDYIVVADIRGGFADASQLARRFLTMTYGSQPVFHRSLTLVGFNRTPERSGRCHIPFLTDYGLKFRITPGAGSRITDEIVEFLSLLGGPELSPADYRLFHSAGKKDLFFLPTTPGLRLRNPLLDPEARSGLEQLTAKGLLTSCEINLTLGFDDLYPREEVSPTHAETIAEDAAADQPTPKPIASQPFCTCRDQIALDFRGLEAELPTGTRDSIRAVYSFFSTVLSDPFRCCDLVHSIASCHDGLLSIFKDLERLREAAREARTDDEERDRLSQWQQSTLAEIQVWCSRVEKVVGERCAGSFESKLVPGDTLAPHRGHINKLLITADNLIAEYLEEITNFWQLTGRVTAPVFHFGATDSVQSDLDSGVVTLPSKYAFSLPLSIPQLWQEAGVRVFQKKYDIKFSDGLGRAVSAYLQRPGLINENALVDKTPRKTIADLADHFSDLMVRYFGFGSRDSFLDYLITLACSRFEIRNSLLPPIREEQYWIDVLRRLYFVFEADYLIQARCPMPGENGAQVEMPPDTASLFEIDPSADGHRRDAIAIITEDIKSAIENLHAMEKPPEGGSRRIEEGKLLPLLPYVQAHVLSEAYLSCHRTYIREFVGRFLEVYGDAEGAPLVTRAMTGRSWAEDLRRLESGELVNLGAVPSRGAYFADAFSRESWNRLERREPNGAGMAAVGRSAFLSFLAARDPDHLPKESLT